jgi:hypothetical protein
MGKPTRNELVAEYYLRAAGVAAVRIDAERHVGAQDVASVENEPGRVIYCCEHGSHFVLAYRLYEWKKSVIVDPPVIAAKLEELAGSGLCESVGSLRKPASERSSGPPSGIRSGATRASTAGWWLGASQNSKRKCRDRRIGRKDWRRSDAIDHDTAHAAFAHLAER